MKLSLITGVLLLAACAQAGGWRNVDAEHYLGGRKASSGYLQGKVVLVCRWKAADEQAAGELLPVFREVWANFKTKRFAILAAPVGDGGEEDEIVRRQLRKYGISYSVYRNAAFEGMPKTKSLPYIYVVDGTGKPVYLGKKTHNATQAVVTALTDIESPKNMAQWKRYLDYEIKNEPCHAYLRLKAFRERFPQLAQEYAPAAKELAAIPNLKAMVDFVAFAKKAKDPPIFSPEEGEKKRKYQALVTSVISNGEAMKGHPDARIAREVKNALADLKWTQAEF